MTSDRGMLPWNSASEEVPSHQTAKILEDQAKEA